MCFQCARHYSSYSFLWQYHCQDACDWPRGFSLHTTFMDIYDKVHGNDMIQVVLNTFWEFREIYAKSHLPFYKVVVVMIVIVSCKHCDLFYMMSHTVPPLSNTNANDIAYFSNGIANKGAHLNNVSEQISVAMQNTSSRCVVLTSYYWTLPSISCSCLQQIKIWYL